MTSRRLSLTSALRLQTSLCVFYFGGVCFITAGPITNLKLFAWGGFEREFEFERWNSVRGFAIQYEACHSVREPVLVLSVFSLINRCQADQCGSGRGDTHSQISLEVTNCQLSLHSARVLADAPSPSRARAPHALCPYVVPCTSAPRGPVCVLQYLPRA
jgi:hypothetical protein